MTNKSGSIGTKTETAIVRHALANGFAGADEMTEAQRLRLKGAHDQGDIGLCPGVMISSKGGHMAEDASDAEIATWLAEAEEQRKTRRAEIAFLVRKRKGKSYTNAGPWWAHMTGSTFVRLATTVGPLADIYGALPAVRMTLDEALDLLRRAGYGDPR